MDPLKILELLTAQGAMPQPPQTPIPALDFPSAAAPTDKPEDDAVSEIEKIMSRMKDEQDAARLKPTGGAAMLNPFYSQSSPGIGGDTMTKLASSMGGK